MNPLLPSAPRLLFAPLSLADSDFIVTLLGDADFRRYIGDRGVQHAGDVEAYLREGPWRCYAEHRFGLLKLTERMSGQPIGIAGLLRRASLSDVDLGYALLPAFRRRGYASEACQALLRLAANDFALTRLVAIVSPGNTRSIATLQRSGFVYERMIRMPEVVEELRLYGCELPSPVP